MGDKSLAMATSPDSLEWVDLFCLAFLFDQISLAHSFRLSEIQTECRELLRSTTPVVVSSSEGI